MAALWGQATESVTKEQALRQCVQGWVQILGPTTANAFAELLGLASSDVFQAFVSMEMQ